METKNLTWLHLSDLHMCKPKTGWKAEGILDKLYDDIKKLETDYKLIPHLIFVTGDLAYGQMGKGEGKSITEQFEEAAVFIDRIRTSYDKEIPLENVFLVPGNHDVSRDKINNLLYDGLISKAEKDREKFKRNLNGLISKKGTEWQDFIKRLDDYKQFLQDRGYSHLLQRPDHLIYSHRREVNELIVGIAGFNSAWSCSKEVQKAKLLLGGEWQIETLLKRLKGTGLKIALMHHPFSWFNKVEDPEMDSKMAGNFDFFLHGHEHRGWVMDDNDGYVRISSGAGFGDSEQEMGYSMVRLDFDGGEAKAWLRKYNPAGAGGWVPNTISNKTDNDGVWIIKSFAQRFDITKPEPAKTAPPPPRPDVTVPDEAVMKEDSPESRGVFGRRKEIDEIAKELETTRVITLEGMPGIGKSMLVNEIRKHRLHEGKGYVSYACGSSTTLDDMFLQLAKVLGCTQENPDVDFKKGERYDFSILEKYAENSSPAIIHLEKAQNLFSYDGFEKNEIKLFLYALIRFYPGVRFILESRREPPRQIFFDKYHTIHQVRGIDSRNMAFYFRHPFKDRTRKGWELSPEDSEYIYQQLGGYGKTNGAHPLAMSLLTGVADGRAITPAQVLQGYGFKEFEEKLEDRLFNDLYDNVLKDTERRMLRICAKYRDEGVPALHLEKLSNAVDDRTAFGTLLERFLMTSDEKGVWYHLHTLIRQLTHKKIIEGGDEYIAHHKLIGGIWLKQLEFDSFPTFQNIRATLEALYHLGEGKSYQLLYKLSTELLNKNALPYLDKTSSRLLEAGETEDLRHVLALIVRLSPKEAKYHRFLAGTIERLEGKGADEALKHFQTAHELDKTQPENLANLGRCLLARKEPERFIALVAEMDVENYKKAMDHHNLAIHCRCLEAAGRGEEAVGLRREQIDNNSFHPSFYNDEAKYLMGKEQYDKALAVLELAVERKCADDFTISIMAEVWEHQGGPEHASTMRREQIKKKADNPAFYNDEAKYLMGKAQYDKALEVLERAEERNCADHHTLAIKARVWEKQGHREQASRLRWEHMDKKSRHAAFYNDEAMALIKENKYDEARAILDKADALGCADEYTRNIRERYLKAVTKEKSSKLVAHSS